MAKYHVKSDGSFGVCKAYKGNCPLAKDGEDVMHVTTKAEAQKLSENILAIKFERKQKSLSKKKDVKNEDNSVDKMSEGERRDYLQSLDGSVNEFGEKASWNNRHDSLIWRDSKGNTSRSEGPAIESANGDKEWYQDGRRHRVGGPAIECASGDKEWWLDGKKHRVGGPAIEWANGDKSWYQNGKLNRDDGPAIERANGDKFWYQNGKRHREDGPAIELVNGSKLWYRNGVFHREDGPAVEYDDDDYKEWWVNGTQVENPNIK